ncbi:unnamed protein product [Effrenium voratum]|uniref:CSD domain-containing protein n=1 Tax=Effrenium voratum TaxID=2562239 RepID=A0AA36J4X9_9DINO|nr:unnamed protein product [Effrenium voratum]
MGSHELNMRQISANNVDLNQGLSLDGVEVDAVCIGASINACKVARRWRWALQLTRDSPPSASRIARHAAMGAGGAWHLALLLLATFNQLQVESNTASFNTALAADARESAWEWAVGLVAAMRANRHQADGFSHRSLASRSWRHGLRLQRRRDVGHVAGGWQRVLAQWPWLRGPDCAGFNVAIGTLGQDTETDSWRLSLWSFGELSDRRVRPDMISHMSAMTPCSRKWLWPRSLALFARLEEAQLRPDAAVHSGLAGACEKAQCWREALQLWRPFPQLMEDDLSLSAALKAVAVRGWSFALSLLRGQQPGYMSVDAAVAACGPLWRTALFLGSSRPAAAAAAAEKAGAWEAAQFLASASSEGVESASAVRGGAAVAACRKPGRWVPALHLLHHMAWRSLELETATRNAAVAVMGAGRRWRFALRLAEPSVADSESARAELPAALAPEWRRVLQLTDVCVRRAQLNALSFYSCLDALQSTGRWRLCLFMARLRRPDAHTLTACLNACHAAQRKYFTWPKVRRQRMAAHLRSGQTMTGMVKSYNRRGFGFIMCQALEQDIYFSRESLHPNLQTSDLAGEQIQFEIHRFSDGKLQARNLRALGDVSDFKGSSYGANRRTRDQFR